MLADHLEGPALVPSTHMGGPQLPMTPAPGDLISPLPPTSGTCTHVADTHTHKRTQTHTHVHVNKTKINLKSKKKKNENSSWHCVLQRSSDRTAATCVSQHVTDSSQVSSFLELRCFLAILRTFPSFTLTGEALTELNTTGSYLLTCSEQNHISVISIHSEVKGYYLWGNKECISKPL